VSDQEGSEEGAHLEQVSAELSHGLRRCRVLLDACRAKLTAKSDEPEPIEDEEPELG
jgi:hypothetical protein